MMRLRRQGARALALAAAVSALSACGYFSQTTTELDYNPSDGVSASVGAVGARNLLVVGDKGSEGLVSGALVNTGTSDATVTITTPELPAAGADLRRRRASWSASARAPTSAASSSATSSSRPARCSS